MPASLRALWVGAQESLSEDLGAHLGVWLSVGVVVGRVRFAFVYIELSEVTFVSSGVFWIRGSQLKLA